MTGILFIARLGSTRLKDKHLIKAGDKTFIEWLLSRFANEFKNEIPAKKVKLIIATSDQPENKNFEKIVNHLPIEIFYGNNDNIPQRQLDCANKFDLTNIISIDGDDILCSFSAARKAYEDLNNSKSYVKTSGLPLGMNVMGYQTKFLGSSLKNNSGKLETGWGRIFDEASSTTIQFSSEPNENELRMTLDYEEDAHFFKTIIEFIGERVTLIQDKELIKIIIDQEFQKLNSSKNKVYWDNFKKEKEREQNN